MGSLSYPNVHTLILSVWAEPTKADRDPVGLLYESPRETSLPAQAVVTSATAAWTSSMTAAKSVSPSGSTQR